MPFLNHLRQDLPVRYYLGIDNGAVRKMRDQLFPQLAKTDEMDPRVMARIGYLHEAVGEALAELHGNLDDAIEEMEASLSQMTP